MRWLRAVGLTASVAVLLRIVRHRYSVSPDVGLNSLPAVHVRG